MSNRPTAQKVPESVQVYSDEKYADLKASRKFQATTLTGAYLTSSQIVPLGGGILLC